MSVCRLIRSSTAAELTPGHGVDVTVFKFHRIPESLSICFRTSFTKLETLRVSHDLSPRCLVPMWHRQLQQPSCR
eukprot:119578-Hanusia_phi.AAC.1